MSFDEIWGSIQPGESAESVQPPPGTYEVKIAEGKFFTSKKGELTAVVSYSGPAGEWADVRVLTANGVAQEGRIKAFKVLLSQLGVDANATPAALPALMQNLVGKWFAVEVVATDTLNNVTGEPYLNTQVIAEVPAPAAAPVSSGVTQSPDTVPAAEPAAAAVGW